MTTRRKLATLLLALAVLSLCLMACNDWDGMDRRGWSTPAPTPTCGVCRPDLLPAEGE